MEIYHIHKTPPLPAPYHEYCKQENKGKTLKILLSYQGLIPHHLHTLQAEVQLSVCRACVVYNDAKRWAKGSLLVFYK